MYNAAILNVNRGLFLFRNKPKNGSNDCENSQILEYIQNSGIVNSDCADN